MQLSQMQQRDNITFYKNNQIPPSSISHSCLRLTSLGVKYITGRNINSEYIYISFELCLLENRFTCLVQTLIKDLLLEVSWVKVAYQTLYLHPNCTVCCLSSHCSILKSNKQKLWSNVLLILCFIQYSQITESLGQYKF